MKGFKSLLLLAGLGLIAISSFAQDVKTARVVPPFNRQVPWEIDFNNKASIEVTLKETFGFVYAEVKLNGQGPFRFLIDTGADASIISYELVKKLKLSPLESRDRKFETSHKQATIHTALYLIEELALGEATLKHVPFIASDTASDDFQLLQGLEIEGVIGTNLFHDVILKLDLPENKLVISHHDALSDKEVGELEVNNQYYLPVVKTKVKRKEGISEYDFLVDSGYSGYVKMPVCFKYKDRKQEDSIMTYDVFSQASAGFLSELDGVFMIGGKEIENPKVRYAIGDCEVKQRWGLIGTRFLKDQAISIDQKNRRVIFH
ncbi:aspartyl protease family protein [Candidatus Berkiella aquae]|uniref:Aspartyl protease family protein n=1 Tax=Candidatus Berkiella aquae TaxID=295108 RepID=A0A0Q9Z0A2_9GAMM|nr:pepsin/retropepsin-like aspartic protease family protein [Candidatus Berkiella aquae]MCS5712349.1 aspartyl protease family protein [Candidatus Berkiella aquae]